MNFATLYILIGFLLSTLVSAQLSGNVGPTTTRAQKRAKVCNVMDYGAVASKTSDVGPAINSAFAACKNGGTVYIPPGDYGMSTWVTLNNGKNWAFQLDGIIYRVGTQSGNMIAIENASDFEMYSSTSTGAIQAYGYVFHARKEYGARIIRFVKCSNFSLHDIALVDAPQFHLFLDTCTYGEVYNVIIRGGDEGGLDGIDITGSNIWVHDVEVTNKDECVTVKARNPFLIIHRANNMKSPSHNMLVENIYCNWSGGCAMGSLGTGTDISNILYRNIYTWQSNQMYMIKSNGGSGTVTNCTFENFIGHSNAYSLDLNSYWSSEKVNDGSGVQYSNLKFQNWTGTCANGASRAPINVVCPSSVPCTGITIEDFSMWTDAGNEVLYKCSNAYGSGGCLAAGSGNGASKTMTVAAAPTDYSAPKMAADLQQGFALSASIPIPPIPTTFFPGATPASKLLGAGGTSSSANPTKTVARRWNCGVHCNSER